ncbi:hypothetical protein C1645_807325 [Glomus cerebriforme]|uniref:BTB/POZ domain-containing protein n=1 Tax=Glomus cerebriforme TaxID=658196 RepID=A0A397SMH9_9GLOM|nr:hypothetical protein C1645_807325 [Glomus cerebriforme]
MEKTNPTHLEILNKFESLFESKENYDVILQIGEEENSKEIYAHSLVLCCQSDYFRAAFSSNWAEKKDGKYFFKKPNISPYIFENILRYLYCGKIDLNIDNGLNILKLLIAIDELGLYTLYENIKNYLIDNQKEFLQNDPVEILKMVCNDEALNDIREIYLEMISFEPKILFNSVKFNDLPASLLEIILKVDILNLDEIEIWEYLIKWGLSQEPTFNQDVSNWNQENFNQFQGILSEFIPLIKFYEISSQDYINKVKPYEEILSKELRDDILKFYMVPGYKSILNTCTPRYPRYYIDSVLINQKHMALLASWIDRKEENSRYSSVIPYEFNLLYRSSRDGNKPMAFHKKCDDKGATIVVAKLLHSDQIIGGYNPLFWDSSSKHRSTYDSFIYLFENKFKFRSAKVGYSNGVDSVGGFPSNGPVFGGGNNCHLNCRENNTWYCNANNDKYPKIGIPGVFEVHDYEVFQVIKKQST